MNNDMKYSQLLLMLHLSNKGRVQTHEYMIQEQYSTKKNPFLSLREALHT
uniref:Uncharacterized protein n=1 Tax=Arundo donax TaxID=35708 RepID=A0A0A9CN07_ARUDO